MLHPCLKFNNGLVSYQRIKSRTIDSKIKATLDMTYRGTSPRRKRPHPWDPPRTLGIELLQGPKGRLFLEGEVPLYGTRECVTIPAPCSNHEEIAYDFWRAIFPALELFKAACLLEPHAWQICRISNPL